VEAENMKIVANDDIKFLHLGLY